MLLKGARYGRKGVIGVRPDEAKRANNDHQDHGEHHRIFCDVLPAVICQELGEGVHFVLLLLSNFVISLAADSFRDFPPAPGACQFENCPLRDGYRRSVQLISTAC